jgi:hypothetical protein
MYLWEKNLNNKYENWYKMKLEKNTRKATWPSGPSGIMFNFGMKRG